MKPRFINESFDLMVDNPDHYKLGLFYFNRKDKRVIVTRRNRFLDWPVNFARPFAYWSAISIVAITIFALVVHLVNQK